MTRNRQCNSWRYQGRSRWPSTNMRAELASRGKVTGKRRVGTGVAFPREGRRTVWTPLRGLLKEAAGAAAQTTTRKTVVVHVGRKRPRVVAGGRWSARQGMVRRVVLFGRLRALVGRCVPKQGRRGLRDELVGSSSSCGHVRLPCKVGTIRC